MKSAIEVWQRLRQRNLIAHAYWGLAHLRAGVRGIILTLNPFPYVPAAMAVHENTPMRAPMCAGEDESALLDALNYAVSYAARPNASGTFMPRQLWNSTPRQSH